MFDEFNGFKHFHILLPHAFILHSSYTVLYIFKMNYQPVRK